MFQRRPLPNYQRRLAFEISISSPDGDKRAYIGEPSVSDPCLCRCFNGY